MRIMLKIVGGAAALCVVSSILSTSWGESGRQAAQQMLALSSAGQGAPWAVQASFEFPDAARYCPGACSWSNIFGAH